MLKYIFVILSIETSFLLTSFTIVLWKKFLKKINKKHKKKVHKNFTTILFSCYIWLSIYTKYQNNMVIKTFGFIYTFECIPLCLNHSMQKVSILLLLATHYMTTPLTSFFLYHNFWQYFLTNCLINYGIKTKINSQEKVIYV